MTAIEGPRTLVEIEDADPSRSLELAAAGAQARVAYLLRAAFDRSPLSQKELAGLVGVTEGRVSQVLNSDGNLRITTIARFLRALGYSFELAGKAADSEVQPLERPGPRRRKRTEEIHVYTAGESSQGGMQKVLLSSTPREENPGHAVFTYRGKVDRSVTRAAGNAIFRNLTVTNVRGVEGGSEAGRRSEDSSRISR